MALQGIFRRTPMAGTMNTPVLNCIMLVKNRPRLTCQSLATLAAHTTNPFTLVIVDDGSDARTRVILDSFHHSSLAVMHNQRPLGVGGSRNAGIAMSDKVWPRGDYLVLLDNDVYCTKGWDEVMLDAFAKFPIFDVLGPYGHPYSQPNRTSEPFDKAGHVVQTLDAVSGVSWVLPWRTWTTYGKFVANALGSGQSEDVEYCQRIVKAGGCVGKVWPHVLFHTGRTNTEGKPIVGADVACPDVPGVLVE